MVVTIFRCEWSLADHASQLVPTLVLQMRKIATEVACGQVPTNSGGQGVSWLLSELIGA